MTTYGKHCDRTRSTVFEKAAALLGLGAAALGIATLVGWANNILALTSVLPHLVPMQPNTALCFIAAGSGVVAARRSRTDGRWRIVQSACACVLLILSSATLAEDVVDIPIGIDQMLTNRSTVPGHAPGRMAVATSVCFALIGLALGLFDTRRRAAWREGAVLLAAVVATLSLTGYAYGVAALYGVGFYSSMALHTALGVLLLVVALLCARPEEGILALLIGNTAGGVLARRLLPLALSAPFLIGWLRIEGERAGWYHSDFGVAITSVTYVVLFSISIWRTARTLQGLDEARRAAERGREEKQAQLAGLIDSAMDGIIMVDAAQTILVFNRAAEKVFGHQASAIIGRHLDVLMPQRFQSQHADHMRRFDAGSTYSRRMGREDFVTGVRADGSEVPLDVSIARFDSSDGARYTAIVRDMTDRIHAQRALQQAARREWMRAEELSKLLNAVPAAVCFAHDPLAARLSGNALYHAWFRGQPADNPAQAGPGDALRPIVRGPELDVLLQAAQGHELRDHELSFVAPDGTARHLLGNALPLFDEQGALIGAISAFIDVTARKQSELALLSATAASFAKTTFITHLTHELRTPLTTMLGHAQMLQLAKVPPTAAQARSVRQILDAGWTMRDLINDVQSVAATEAAGIAMYCERTAIDQVLGEVAAMLGPLFRNAGLDLELPAPGGVAVEVNPLRIRQVLINLLSNAVKSSRPGGRITVRCETAAHRQVRISIEDSGLERVSEKRAQLLHCVPCLDQERAGEEGARVELAVTQTLIEAMGGTIGVERPFGRGTLVWFCIPCTEDSCAAVEQA